MAYTQLFAILSSADLPRLVDFYVTAVDAVVSYTFPAEDGGYGYVALDLAGGHLGIGRDPQAPVAAEPQRAALWLYVDDCDAACARMVAAGAALVQAPADMAWGERVADLTDPDGNRIHLGQRPGADDLSG